MKLVYSLGIGTILVLSAALFFRAGGEQANGDPIGDEITLSSEPREPAAEESAVSEGQADQVLSEPSIAEETQITPEELARLPEVVSDETMALIASQYATVPVEQASQEEARSREFWDEMNRGTEEFLKKYPETAVLLEPQGPDKPAPVRLTSADGSERVIAGEGDSSRRTAIRLAMATAESPENLANIYDDLWSGLKKKSPDRLAGYPEPDAVRGSLSKDQIMKLNDELSQLALELALQ